MTVHNICSACRSRQKVLLVAQRQCSSARAEVQHQLSACTLWMSERSSNTSQCLQFCSGTAISVLCEYLIPMQLGINLGPRPDVGRVALAESAKQYWGKGTGHPACGWWNQCHPAVGGGGLLRIGK